VDFTTRWVIPSFSSLLPRLLLLDLYSARNWDTRYAAAASLRSCCTLPGFGILEHRGIDDDRGDLENVSALDEGA